MSGDANEKQPTNQPSYHNINSSWKDVEAWINRATKAHNDEYLKNTGVAYKETKTLEQLETYILTAAFGSNGVKQCHLTVSLKFWYTHDYRSVAAKIRKKITKLAKSSTVKLNTVFVMALLQDTVENKKTNKTQNKETTETVFYFQDCHGNIRYIDLFARVYNGWDDYLTSNWIDPALICYSKVGHYGQDQPTDKPAFDSNILPDLTIQESPACGALRTVGRWVKKTLAVVTPILTVATVVGVIPGLKNMKYIANESILPVCEHIIDHRLVRLDCDTSIFLAEIPLVTFSSMISIIDIGTHGGWGGWNDDWDCDLSLVAEVTAIVSSVLTILTDDLAKRYLKGKIAAGQQELTAGQAFFLNLFAWSRCASSIAAVVATLITMMYKPKCSAMDYFLLASSVYSCCGMLTSPKTAQGMFEQVREEYRREVSIAQKKEAGEKKTENDQSTDEDKAKTDSNTKKDENTESDGKKDESTDSTDGTGKNDKADPGNNTDENEDPKEPPKKEPTKEELIEQRRDELAKKMMAGDDDVAGKAAYDYYREKIVSVFKGKGNEYVMNQQLVRMMENAPSIRDLFCEITLTETTLDIRDGILLVNGQLNIDGGALAQVHNGTSTDVAERLRKKIENKNGSATSPGGTKGDRETLFEETKDYNTNPKYQNLTPIQRETEDANFLTRVQLFAGNNSRYRLFFEADTRNFDRQFSRDVGQPLDQYEVGGKKVFENMSTANKQRLHQQLSKLEVYVENPATQEKEPHFNPELFDAAVVLANARGCVSARDLASCIGIMFYESRTSGVDRTVFLNDVINGSNGRLQTIQQNISTLMPDVEQLMEDNDNHRGFHNSYEAYEHVLQHRPKPQLPPARPPLNPAQRVQALAQLSSDPHQRLLDAQKYLTKSVPTLNPQPPNPQSSNPQPTQPPNPQPTQPPNPQPTQPPNPQPTQPPNPQPSQPPNPQPRWNQWGKKQR